MATSGITVNQLSRDTIINAALRKCQILQEGQSANANQLTTGAEALNALVTEFVSIGMPIWKRTDRDITLVNTQATYTIGVGQSINAAYPTHLLQVRYKPGNADTLQDMEIKADFDFKLLPDSDGVPVSVTYKPLINQGILSVWPTPDSSVPSGSLIKITYTTPFEVFSAAADTPDFPQEWNNALIYGLASLLADEYALSIQDKQWIDRQAEKHISTALANGAEDASWFFQINREG